MNNQSQSNEKFFDLHTSGIGYLNRPREVAVKRGEPFLAVDINAIHGSENDLQQTRFDCRVSGADAQLVVRHHLMPAVEADKKVLIGFKLGDLYVDTFVYQTGNKAGQTGVSLKARLLRILWAKVDGEFVYRAPSESNEPQESAVSHDSVAHTPVALDKDHSEVGTMDRETASAPESLLTEVFLSKDDPAFEQKKQSLKNQGYRWNQERQSWCLPQQRAA